MAFCQSKLEECGKLPAFYDYNEEEGYHTPFLFITTACIFGQQSSIMKSFMLLANLERTVQALRAVLAIRVLLLTANKDFVKVHGR